MSTSRQNRKTKDPKARGRRVSRFGGDFQDEEEAAKFPFYTLDPSTQRLEPLARNALNVEQAKNSYLHASYSGETSDTQGLSPKEILDTYQSEEERFEWISRDYLMRDIAQMIATGDWKGLRTISDIVGSYEATYDETLASQNAAMVWTMVACDQLYDKGRNRNQVTKAQIRAEAEGLWARAM
jgi:hypothetical protein